MSFKNLGKKLLVGATALGLFAGQASQVLAQEEPVKVGANFEQTGYSASYGQAMLEALELAVEQRNAAGGVLGGRQLEIVAYDNQSDKTETASVATRLMDEGVVAILGPGATDLALAQNPIITTGETLAILPAATADHLTRDENGNVLDWLFRVAFTYTYQGKAAARFATDELGAKKAVMVVDQSNDYSVGLADPFKAEFEALGGEVISSESFTGGDSDFMALLTTLLSLDFDVLYLPAFYTEGGLITKQARELGLTQPILSGHGFASSKLVELATPEFANDIYYTSHFYTGSDDPAVQEFVTAFEEKFGKKPDTFAALGYDAANLLFQAIEEAGSTDRQAVRDALENMESFTGLTGTFSFDDFHNAVKTAPMLHMDGGQVVEVFEVDGN